MDYARSESRVPEWMPAITCIAEFLSYSPARDDEMMASALTVIWLQDDFAMPIAAPCLEAIKAIDWKKRATDFDF